MATGLQSGEAMRRSLVLAVCLTLVGSSAAAGPRGRAEREDREVTKGRRKGKAVRDDARETRDERRARRRREVKEEREERRERRGRERVAFRAEDIDLDDIELEGEDAEGDEAEIRVYEGAEWRDRDDEDDGWRDRDGDDDDDHDGEWRDRDDDDDWRDDAGRVERRVRRGKRARAKEWSVAVGPYLWASSVDANVSLGGASVSTGVDFMEIKRNARYGATALVEVRYRRWAVYGDAQYGVVALDGAREVGPFMVALSGTATSLMLDGAAGYRVVGDVRSWLALEARAGVRYQRTAIAGAVNVAGADVSNPQYVDAAADGLVGAQVMARPWSRLTLAGTFDLGVVGDSNRTWSAAADAGVRLGRRVLLSVGWKTLTTERTNVSIVMHGPRAAVQLTF